MKFMLFLSVLVSGSISQAAQCLQVPGKPALEQICEHQEVVTECEVGSPYFCPGVITKIHNADEVVLKFWRLGGYSKIQKKTIPASEVIYGLQALPDIAVGTQVIVGNRYGKVQTVFTNGVVSVLYRDEYTRREEIDYVKRGEYFISQEASEEMKRQPVLFRILRSGDQKESFVGTIQQYAKDKVIVKFMPFPMDLPVEVQVDSKDISKSVPCDATSRICTGQTVKVKDSKGVLQNALVKNVFANNKAEVKTISADVIVDISDLQ
jgi:hypothetical protein